VRSQRPLNPAYLATKRQNLSDRVLTIYPDSFVTYVPGRYRIWSIYFYDVLIARFDERRELIVR